MLVQLFRILVHQNSNSLWTHTGLGLQHQPPEGLSSIPPWDRLHGLKNCCQKCHVVTGSLEVSPPHVLQRLTLFCFCAPKKKCTEKQKHSKCSGWHLRLICIKVYSSSLSEQKTTPESPAFAVWSRLNWKHCSNHIFSARPPKHQALLWLSRGG